MIIKKYIFEKICLYIQFSIVSKKKEIFLFMYAKLDRIAK